jgi:hypothetical protein
MGRRPIGEQAMTARERWLRYRERHGKPVKIDAQAARIAELEAELARERSRDHSVAATTTKSAEGFTSASKPVSDGEVAKLRARVTELENELALARIASGKLPKSAAEFAAMERVAAEVRKAEREAKREAAKAERIAQVQVDPVETMATLTDKLHHVEQQLKAARTRNRNLNATLQAMVLTQGNPDVEAAVPADRENPASRSGAQRRQGKSAAHRAGAGVQLVQDRISRLTSTSPAI